MNKLFLILSLSFMLAGEMEVDGDLNVSGDIQSPTIEELQAQIVALQQGANNKLETRIFDKNVSWNVNVEEKVFNLLDITSFDIESAIVHFFAIKNIDVSPESDELEITMHLTNEVPTNRKLAMVRTVNDVLSDEDMSYGTFDNNFIYSKQLDYTLTVNDGRGEPGSITLVFAVTAQFPETRSQK